MGFDLVTFKDKIISLASPFKRDLMYGRSSILRRLGGYPFPLPIKYITEHGVDAVQVDLFEQNSNPYGYIVFSELKAESLKIMGKKNIIQIPDPFSYVVNESFKPWIPQVSLSEKRDPLKLLFFYAHSTDSVVDLRDREEYLNVIKEYSKCYELTVCIHFSDVKRGVGKYLDSQNIAWTYVPEYPRSNFPYRFFSMVDGFGKAASTLPGSYLYYCSYVGIDFELVRLPPMLENRSDSAQTKDFVGFFDEYPNSTAYDLFSIDAAEPTSALEQRKFILELLGYNGDVTDGPSVSKLIRSALRGSLL
jgi:hypothetical protein